MPGERVARIEASLAGLSVGDAFGEQFFHPAYAETLLPDQLLPPPPWSWTDDTNMALSIVAVLSEYGTIDQDALAGSFGERYDPRRGYGRAMHGLLPRYRHGADWRLEAPRLFAGSGSFGNGASMRVAPLGAFFADDLDRTVAEAGRSAEVTHTHPEGKAGAVAVAVAAALAAGGEASGMSFVEAVITRTPPSEVRDRLAAIPRLEPGAASSEVVEQLGNGSRISAQDTVAFTVWAASQHLDDYEAALWLTVGAGGDLDTTCAIVGGILGGRVGLNGIPEEWLRRREPLPPSGPATSIPITQQPDP
jgi:ADP-ribosylglycohydrolase